MHQLVLVDEGKPLRLYRGSFEMNRACVDRGRETFIRWYREHARTILENRVNRYKDRFAAQPTDLKVLDLKYRWGSCSQDGTLNFHWKTILAPMTVVDYIVVHEMAHLIEHNHTPEFWDLVGMVLSDYEKRKGWLERNGKYLDI